MKKFFILSVFFLFSMNVFAQDYLLISDDDFADETATEDYLEAPIVQFEKGNILDKIEAVRRSGEDSELSKRALDFVVVNADILRDDPDIARLAAAAIRTYPAYAYFANPDGLVAQFSDLFYRFDDAEVQDAVLDKMTYFYSLMETQGIVTFVNTFVLNRSSLNLPADEATSKAIDVLGEIGNGSSFIPLYFVMRHHIWPELRPRVMTSLVFISNKSMAEIFEAIDKADLLELELLLGIYGQNSEISKNFSSQIAEKLLKRSMIITGNSLVSMDFADFQLRVAKILAQNQWRQAAELAREYFFIAQSSYYARVLTASQFADAIDAVEMIASRLAVRPFIEYMERLNAEQQQGNPPEPAVALALIQALGALGDKSAFDCILYVMYLNYPEEISLAARDALTRLQW